MKLSGPEIFFIRRFLIIDLISSTDMYSTIQLSISLIVTSLKVVSFFSGRFQD